VGITRDDAYPSRFLKAADLNGRVAIYTVHSASFEDLGREKERKPVVWFKESNKGLVLNVTNWNSVEELYGDNTDQWLGKPIELYPTKTSFGGKRVDCIRLRQPTKDALADELPPGF
jgi:hypothetical protein